MDQHPDEQALRRFVRGELKSSDAHKIDHHLSICTECRDRADEAAIPLILRLQDSWTSYDYDESFDRAAARAADRLSLVFGEAWTTEVLLEELLREPAPARCRTVRNDERFHTLNLCDALQARAQELWLLDPAQSLILADLAIEVAQHLQTEKYGSALVEDARARSWAKLGNLFRVVTDLRRSEQALAQAWLHHLEAGQDSYTEIEILGYIANLRKVQSRFSDAVHLCDRALSLCREGEDHILEADSLIRKGHILGREGQHKSAIFAIREGLNKLIPDENPWLVFHGTHNLAAVLSISGSPIEAERLLTKVLPVYQDNGRKTAAAWNFWLEGLVAKNLGDFPQAETALRKAQESFLNGLSSSDVVSVTLELAEIYCRTGKPRQVKEALSEVIPLTEALGLHRQALMARLLYEQAV
ncbi:MAG: MalT-like region [Acidobacteriota bacterium]|jgi:tetratricopeptide (TPR) repeat protein|nr:MalT-like region [Acidobacteriota bacterium]